MEISWPQDGELHRCFCDLCGQGGPRATVVQEGGGDAIDRRWWGCGGARPTTSANWEEEKPRDVVSRKLVIMMMRKNKNLGRSWAMAHGGTVTRVAVGAIACGWMARVACGASATTHWSAHMEWGLHVAEWFTVDSWKYLQNNFLDDNYETLIMCLAMSCGFLKPCWVELNIGPFWTLWSSKFDGWDILHPTCLYFVSVPSISKCKMF